jgi:hypothetical protein
MLGFVSLGEADLPTEKRISDKGIVALDTSFLIRLLGNQVSLHAGANDSIVRLRNLLNTP